MAGQPPPIGPEQTILEVVYNYPQTEPVFRRYDGQAGVCLLCQALFDTLAEAAAKYGLSLGDLLADLQGAVLSHNS